MDSAAPSAAAAEAAETPPFPAGAAPPLTVAELAWRLDRLGPFEDDPTFAVALSGGPDSLALVHLLAELTRNRGGRIVAVTVDHGLRPGSEMEAAAVAGWMRRAGIRHETLPWMGPKPASNLQAEARAARYRLLDAWCGRAGILHLLTAHHADDQMETRILRLARRAGPTGLAGMSAIEPLDRCQILRPLLDVPRVRLAAALAGRNLLSVDDPSNRNPRFDRVRVRTALAATRPETDDPIGMVEARRAEDILAARLLAQGATLSPLGHARLAAPSFFDAPDLIAIRALGTVLATVGGTPYPPARAAIEAAYAAWRRRAARTLGGCRLIPAPDASLLVCREAGRIADAGPIAPGEERLWDGRFRLSARHSARHWARDLQVRRLDDDTWRALLAAATDTDIRVPPRPVRLALPAIYRGTEPVGLPSLDLWAPGAAPVVSARFAPLRPMSAGPFVAADDLV